MESVTAAHHESSGHLEHLSKLNTAAEVGCPAVDRFDSTEVNVDARMLLSVTVSTSKV